MKDNNNYISLQEATKYCLYSQEYLSLLARQRKLKSVKIGRNWVTKKEWLISYLKTVNGDFKNNKRIIKEKKEIEPPNNLPIEGLNNKFAISVIEDRPILKKFSFPTIKQQPFLKRKFSIPLVKHQPIFIEKQKTSFSKNWTLPRFSLKFFVASFFILLIIGGFFVFPKVSLNNFSKEAKNISSNLSLQLASISLEDIRFSTLNNFKEYINWLFNNVKTMPQKFVKGYSLFSNFIEDKIQKGYQKFAIFFNPSRNIPLSEEELNPKPVKEGMAVIPYAGTTTEEEAKKKIQKAFSDEVKVEPKDESSGLIIPIFKKEKEGDKYLYVLVPINN